MGVKLSSHHLPLLLPVVEGGPTDPSWLGAPDQPPLQDLFYFLVRGLGRGEVAGFSLG